MLQNTICLGLDKYDCQPLYFIHAVSVYIFRHFWTDEHYICFREDENEGKGSLSLFRLKEMKVGRSYLLKKKWR